MKSIDKILLLVSIFTLVLVSEAFALPIAGDYVKMELDSEVPFTMTDGETVYQSFCLERKNPFKPGETYLVTSVGNYATGGGGGADNGGDKVSGRTKWLYAAFMSGTFDGVNNAARKVQNAIWWLEDEVADDHKFRNNWRYFSNNFDFFNTFQAGWSIAAVNISKDGIDNQSQLIGEAPAPVPEPATMILFGVGLAGLAGSRLRRKK